MECPAPGIYYDVPFRDYLSWDAISNSRLNLAMKTLAHFKFQVPLNPTPPLILGQLVHCGRLEPLSIAKRYAILPRYEQDEDNKTKDGDRSHSKTTVYYQNKVRAFTEANRGKEIVSEPQYELMAAAVASLSRDELAASLFGEDGPVEASFVWIDEDTGLLCKIRVDKVSRDWSRVTDLKTTRDAMAFAKAIANFGYHRQMAHYRRGIKALTGITPTPYLVAVETDMLCGVRAAPLSLESIETGEAEVDRMLRSIAEARTTDNWPCYESPERWALPAWYGDSGEPIELTVNGETVSI